MIEKNKKNLQYYLKSIEQFFLERILDYLIHFHVRNLYEDQNQDNL